MSLKKNAIYSTLLTISTYLVPLFVYPYISRVLLAAGIGAIDSVDSIINYSILISMMGLTTIGIREIAKYKYDKDELNRTFSSLFSLNIISTVLVLVLLTCLLLFLPGLTDRKDLFLVGMTKIVFNLFWIEWFFKGMEDFRYITIRSILLRVLFVISVFVFVKDANDTLIYYMLFVGITAGNAICNWTYRMRYVKFSIKDISLKEYSKPFIIIGLFALLSAIYTQLNVAYLKYSCGDEQVGYYTTATKSYLVLIAVFSSFTGVMIPRMSALVKEGKYDDIKGLIMRVFSLLFLFAFPIVIFFELFAPEFIRLFAGTDFFGAVIPMRLVILQLFIIGTEQIFILQLLIPAGKDRESVNCAILGAVMCIIVNIVLTHHFKSIGSATAWISAELSVMLLSSKYVKKYFGIRFPWKLFFKYAFLSIPYIVFGLCVFFFIDGVMTRLLFGSILFTIWGLIVEEKIMKIGILDSFLKSRLKS